MEYSNSNDISNEEARAVEKLVRRLGRKSRIRPIAERILDRRAPDTGDAYTLVDTVANRNAPFKDQIVAAWALGWVREGTLQTDAVEILCDVLHAKRIPVVAWGCLGFSFFPVFMFGWPFLVYAMIRNQRANRLKRQAAQSLGRIRSLYSIMPLAMSAKDGNWYVSEAATAALIEILPLLTESDAGFCGDAIPHLCKLFPNLRYLSRVTVVLQALAKIGDGRAVGPVEKLAREGSSRTIREAAEAILPVLRERQERERAASRLLRAAAAPAEPEKTLLRPAGQSNTESELLLRSANPNA